MLIHFCSDVSDLPEETYPLLKDCEILILVPPYPTSLSLSPLENFIFALEITRA